MTEPTPAHGQTWEALVAERIMQKSSVELALAVDPPWHEQEQLKGELAQLRFDISVAMKHVDSEALDINW